MSTLKPGDQVRVMCNSYYDTSLPSEVMNMLSRACEVRFLSAKGVVYVKDLHLGSSWPFNASDLELISARVLLPGMRVRATQDSRPTWRRGYEGVVVTVDAGYDERYIAVDFGDGRTSSHYEADELEVLPERRPKVGDEVLVKETGERSRVMTMWRPVKSVMDLTGVSDRYELLRTSMLYGTDELEVLPAEARA